MRIKSAKIKRNCLSKVKWLKIDGCMHPLLKIKGCSCTLCNCYYEGPAMHLKIVTVNEKPKNCKFAKIFSIKNGSP